jgi:ATP-dependent Clp protease ATP-binding subunit ClpC
VFHELSKVEVKSIVDLLMRRVADQLRSQDVEIELTDATKDLLVSKGYDPTLGARPLRRAIQRMIEDQLSEKILWKEFEAGDVIVVDVEKDESGEDAVVFRKAERTPDLPPVEPVTAASGEGDA